MAFRAFTRNAVYIVVINILFIGDVVGPPGCSFVESNLRTLKQTHNIDVVIANGENSAQGNGMLPGSADSLLNAGVDVITGGNHSFRRKEIYEYLDSGLPVIRPYNLLGAKLPGQGYYILDRLRYRVCVLNILGSVYMDSSENPFHAVDRVLSSINERIIIVDMHAEANGEKLALANYLAERVTAVIGTHTHVQTADETILRGHTGYITDAGMTGPINSVLGVKTELAIRKMSSSLPVRFEAASGPCFMNAVVLTVDEKDGKTVKISRIIIKQG